MGSNAWVGFAILGLAIIVLIAVALGFAITSSQRLNKRPRRELVDEDDDDGLESRGQFKTLPPSGQRPLPTTPVVTQSFVVGANPDPSAAQPAPASQHMDQLPWATSRPPNFIDLPGASPVVPVAFPAPLGQGLDMLSQQQASPTTATATATGAKVGWFRRWFSRNVAPAKDPSPSLDLSNGPIGQGANLNRPTYPIVFGLDKNDVRLTLPIFVGCERPEFSGASLDQMLASAAGATKDDVNNIGMTRDSSLPLAAAPVVAAPLVQPVEFDEPITLAAAAPTVIAQAQTNNGPFAQPVQFDEPTSLTAAAPATMAAAAMSSVQPFVLGTEPKFSIVMERSALAILEPYQIAPDAVQPCMRANLTMMKEWVRVQLNAEERQALIAGNSQGLAIVQDEVHELPAVEPHIVEKPSSGTMDDDDLLEYDACDHKAPVPEVFKAVGMAAPKRCIAPAIRQDMGDMTLASPRVVIFGFATIGMSTTTTTTTPLVKIGMCTEKSEIGQVHDDDAKHKDVIFHLAGLVGSVHHGLLGGELVGVVDLLHRPLRWESYLAALDRLLTMTRNQPNDGMVLSMPFFTAKTRQERQLFQSVTQQILRERPNWVFCLSCARFGASSPSVCFVGNNKTEYDISVRDQGNALGLLSTLDKNRVGVWAHPATCNVLVAAGLACDAIPATTPFAERKAWLLQHAKATNGNEAPRLWLA